MRRSVPGDPAYPQGHVRAAVGTESFRPVAKCIDCIPATFHTHEVTRRMKTAIIVEYLHARGGTQRQALELAHGLLRRGHSVVLFTGWLDRSACFPDKLGGLTIHAVHEHSPDATSPEGPSPLLSRVPESARTTARAAGLNYAAQYLKMRSSTSRLVALIERNADGIDVLNPHDFGPAIWAASEVGHDRALPVVWQCNDPLLRWTNPATPIARIARDLLLRADRHRVRHPAAITVLDHRVARVVEDRHGGSPIVVRSGVDVMRFAALPPRDPIRDRLALPSNAIVALVLTLLDSDHRRVEDAIRAHAMLPPDNWLLLAAPAPTPDYGYAALVTATLNASPARNRIVWRREPFQSDDELLCFMAASDLLVFPNVKQTWGLAVMEAAAAGLCVLVSDQAGASEVLVHDESALIFRGGSALDLARHWKHAAEDAVLRARLARAGQLAIADRFTWDDFASHYATILGNATHAGT